jgi:hypothetical protein
MRIAVGALVAVLLTVPRISAAQVQTSSAVPQLPRVYADVNLFGYADPSGGPKTFENYALTFGEVATFRAAYPKPAPSGLFPAYIGGGFMLNRSVGIGASYSRMSWESVVDLSAEVPHPTFLNAVAAGTGTTRTALSRTDSAIHISLAVAPVRSNRLEFRMMGGPSFFTMKSDMVQYVEYDQTFNDDAPESAITITGGSSREATGTAIGLHLGADFTYFVHRIVGIAGGVRFGQSLVAATEPLSRLTQQFRVGSTTMFFGLRFRLGRAPLDK